MILLKLFGHLASNFDWVDKSCKVVKIPKIKQNYPAKFVLSENGFVAEQSEVITLIMKHI